MNSFDASADSFEQNVISASHHQPILVDFWATWCGPCQSLMPILEKLAAEYASQFKLAKVNIDEQESLAQQYSVRSVPTVILIKNGQAVEQFIGAQSESEIRVLLDKHITPKSNNLMLSLMQQYKQASQDETANLIQSMIDLINNDPDNTQIRIMYVNVLMSEKQYADATAILEALPHESRTSPEIIALLGQLEFLSNASNSSDDVNSLLKQLENDDGNCDLRYQLSSLYIVQSNFEQALEQLLEIMRRDRKFNDDAGRKGMLKVFAMLGGSGELVTRYRQKMARLLN